MDERITATVKPRLTLDTVQVQELAERKGEMLSWADFEDYAHTETGSGFFIRDTGDGSILTPQGNATRAQLAVMLYRFIQPIQ